MVRTAAALKKHGYDITVLECIPGFGGSTSTSNTETMKASGIECTAATTLSRKTHTHSVIYADNILKCRRFLERPPHGTARPVRADFP